MLHYMVYILNNNSVLKDTSNYGGPQVSRQEQEAHGKSKKLTATAESSRQEREAHGKSRKLTARAESSRQEHHRRGLGTTSLIAKHHGTFSKWLPPHVLGLCRLCLRLKKS
jgi:hypothetical protein